MSFDAYGLKKQERMVSRKLMETLFGGGGQSMIAYPLRVVYMKRERQAGDAPVQILVSVSKKRFRHAVDRNRVKRQVREGYRKHKHILWEAVTDSEQLLLALVWLSDRHQATQEVESRLTGLMQRVAEKVRSQQGEDR